MRAADRCEPLLAVAQADGVRLYERTLRRVTLPDAEVGCLAFLNPGQLLTGNTQPEKPDDRSGCLKLWDVRTGRCLSVFSHLDASHLSQVVAQPDGRVLVGCAWDKTLLQLDANTGEEYARLPADNTMLGGIAGSPDGRRAATGGMEKVVRLWDLEEQKLLAECPGHGGYIGALAFSGDGSLLVSGAADATVRGWDVRTGRERFKLTGHTGPIWCVALSPDGRLILSGSFDETWRLWSVEKLQTLASGRLSGPPLRIWLEPTMQALTQNGHLEPLLAQPGAQPKGPWRLFVADNFQHQDPGHEVSDHANAEDALRACRKVIDDFLDGRTGDQAFYSYETFGPYPYVIGPESLDFSPRDYAYQKTREN